LKFKFSYQKLLEHRKLEEDVARRDAAEAQKAVDRMKLVIEGMYDQIDDSRLRALKVERAGGSCSQSLSGTDEFITGQKKLIEMKKHELRGLMQIAEAAREVLVAKAKDTKILLKLRENRQLAHRAHEKKREIKINDDLATMRFGRKDLL
jgi:flagellar export protein FliJ